ncbi:DUF421 domain-containing protein [Alicyclobacillus fastidiosus]|uniref:DUF421 domain-containing protein n=1 Tax=Alicyclobacillus fastidiosus TaxID=392011 RepID=A0ABY6ZLX2_9BACL|nr:DUF421 domain-containing protein [Alicyclobacillus fastidiosus]WAH43918.1 DUF421 domain-containing protein [Alicyclobacillus fastidiosus]GMA60161.1 hypothetical protein GCM10025859_06010 [Alicyclobacillus fastidiosus]
MPIYIEIIIRSAISFVLLIAICRLTGVSFKVVLPVGLAVIGVIFSFDRSIRVIDGLVAIITWGALTVIYGFLAIKFEQAQSILNGSPTVLIENGNIIGKNLMKVRMTTNDLLALLREKDAFKLADVEFAALETDGQVSVMKQSDVVPVTPKVAGIEVQKEKPPKVVMKEGKPIKKTLSEEGYSELQLFAEAEKQGATCQDDVFLAQLDGSQNLYVDLKVDALKKSPDDPSNKSKLLLLSSLRKLQADLESHALNTENVQAKASYENQAKDMQQIIEQVQRQLQKESQYGPD